MNLHTLRRRREEYQSSAFEKEGVFRGIKSLTNF